MTQTRHIKHARSLKGHSKLKVRQQPPAPDPETSPNSSRCPPEPSQEGHPDPPDPHVSDHQSESESEDEEEFLLAELAKLKQRKLLQAQQEQQAQRSSSPLKRATSWRQTGVKRTTKPSSASLVLSGKPKTGSRGDFLDKFVK